MAPLIAARAAIARAAAQEADEAATVGVQFSTERAQMSTGAPKGFANTEAYRAEWGEDGRGGAGSVSSQ